VPFYAILCHQVKMERAVILATENSDRERLDDARRQICALRESLLDLLLMVEPRWGASTDIPMAESERLRRSAASAEHREFKIGRARSVIDGGKEYDTDWNEAIDSAVRIAAGNHYGKMVVHEIRALRREAK
jgi:hypothetical protein